MSLVQMNAIEMHPWGSRVETLEQPDRMVFDLDPDESIGWSDIKAAAREVRDRLEELGLPSDPRLSGGKGVHVVVPLRPQADWEQVRHFCEAFADAMAAGQPDRYVATMSKAKRKETDLHRLAAQWPRRHQCRRLVAARAQGRAGGDADHLGGAGPHPPPRPVPRTCATAPTARCPNWSPGWWRTRRSCPACSAPPAMSPAASPAVAPRRPAARGLIRINKRRPLRERNGPVRWPGGRRECADMLKDLLVPMTKTAGDADALETAIALASREDAHLCVLETIDLPVDPLARGDWYRPGRQRPVRDPARDGAAQRRAFPRAAAAETLSSEVRIAESLLIDSAATAAVHGRYCDMAIMTGATDDSRDGLTVQDFFSSLLLDSGRPVLVIPARCTAQRPVRRAVVAGAARARPAARCTTRCPCCERPSRSTWSKSNRATPRAPTRKAAPPSPATSPGTASRCGWSAAAGTRDGGDGADPPRRPVRRRPALPGATDTRFREWALGGVTRELLQFGPMPMLFAH